MRTETTAGRTDDHKFGRHAPVDILEPFGGSRIRRHQYCNETENNA